MAYNAPCYRNIYLENWGENMTYSIHGTLEYAGMFVDFQKHLTIVFFFNLPVQSYPGWPSFKLTYKATGST